MLCFCVRTPVQLSWIKVIKHSLAQPLFHRSVQTLAEKVAWDLSKKHGFQLVTINPVFVFGPVLSCRADATSVLMMKV